MGQSSDTQILIDCKGPQRELEFPNWKPVLGVKRGRESARVEGRRETVLVPHNVSALAGRRESLK